MARSIQSNESQGQYVFAIRGDTYNKVIRELQEEMQPGGDFSDHEIVSLAHAFDPSENEHFLTVVVNAPKKSGA